MNSFKTPLVVTPLDDGRRWRLVFSFVYVTRALPIKVRIDVPVGFVTDFASVPWLAWSFIPKWGKYGKAAIVHDYLYQFLQWMLEQPQHKPLFDYFYETGDNRRKFADDVFLEAMEKLGVTPWRRSMMYRAVRLFGWLAWKRAKKKISAIMG